MKNSLHQTILTLQLQFLDFLVHDFDFDTHRNRSSVLFSVSCPECCFFSTGPFVLDLFLGTTSMNILSNISVVSFVLPEDV